MKLVALIGRPKDPDAAVRLLVAEAGFAPAEARMRIAPEPPALLAQLDEAHADALCAKLRAAGLAAVVCPARVQRDQDRLVARTLELGADAAVFTPRSGPSLRVAWGEVRALFRGIRMSQETEIHTETHRRFSLETALVTQGLKMTTTEKREVRTETESVSHFILVYGGAQPVAVYETEVAFTCLGADVRPSRLQNLEFVAARLRARCPGAFYDDRLLRLGRRPLPFAAAGPVDAVAALLWQAVEEGLLP